MKSVFVCGQAIYSVYTLQCACFFVLVCITGSIFLTIIANFFIHHSSFFINFLTFA